MKQQRLKPRILFLFYTDTKEQSLFCQKFTELSLIGPLKETDIADYEIMWYGPWMAEDWEHLNRLIFRQCEEYHPEILFLMNGWQPDLDERGVWSPRLATLFLIREVLGIRITTLWMDIAYSGFNMADILTPLCDRVYTLEHPERFRNHSQFPEKYTITTATYSRNYLAADALMERDIDILFIGQIDGYDNQRAEGISALRKKGLSVFVPGGQGKGQDYISNEEYAELHQRAKIIVSWSQHISGQWYQAKGRVFEGALAGALVLCEECDAINLWFEPGVDYVPFTNIEQLVERACYYLEHKNERLKIASQGAYSMLTRLDAKTVWSQRIEELLSDSYYNTDLAISSIIKNVSPKEAKIAQILFRHIRSGAESLDLSQIEPVIDSIKRTNRSLFYILNRRSWYMRNLRLVIKPIVNQLRSAPRRGIRKILPAHINRKSIYSFFKV